MRAERSRRTAPLAAALLLIAATGTRALAGGITRPHAKSDFWTKAGNDLKTANSKTTHAIDSTWNGLMHDLGIRTAAKHKATTPATAAASNPQLVPWLIGLVNQDTTKPTPTIKTPLRWTHYGATPAGSPAETAIQAMPATAPSAPSPAAAHAALIEAQVLAPLVSPAPVPEPSSLLVAAGLLAGAAALRRFRRA